jgi:hypothetical protein
VGTAIAVRTPKIVAPVGGNRFLASGKVGSKPVPTTAITVHGVFDLSDPKLVLRLQAIQSRFLEGCLGAQIVALIWRDISSGACESKIARSVGLITTQYGSRGIWSLQISGRRGGITFRSAFSGAEKRNAGNRRH